MSDGAIDADISRERLRQALLAGRGGSHWPSIPRASRTDEFVPLSVGQRRLWLADQMSLNDNEYLIPIGLRFDGEIRASALRQALEDLTRRHEVLRTRYLDRDGRGVQVIDPPRPVEMPVIDLRSLSPSVRAERTDDIIAAARRPIGLVRGPIFSAQLIQLADDEHVLLIVIHHIAFDGWSQDVFVRDLRAFYRQRCGRNEDVTLPDLPCQYADYARWNATSRQAGEVEADLEYWRPRLLDIQPLQLTRDQPRVESYGAIGQRVLFSIDATLGRAARRLAAELDATPFVLFLSAFQLLLMRYGNTREVAVGVPVSNRDHPDTHELIGFFVDTVVIRSSTAPEASLRQMVTNVREDVLGALSHRTISFDELVDQLQPMRHGVRMPFFQAMFELHDQPGVYHSWDEHLAVEEYSVDWAVARCDLSIGLVAQPDGSFAGEVIFPAELFGEPAMQRLADHYVRLLRSAVDAPSNAVTTLEMRTDAEMRAIEKMAAPAETFAVRRGLQHGFGAMVETSPDAIAVIDGEREFSYLQLDEASDRLSRRLRAVGVERGSIVGVHLGRSIEAVIAFLAVVKAGAAYLPLDPDNPPQRLAFLLESSNACAVVTTGSSDNLPGDIPRVPISDIGGSDSHDDRSWVDIHPDDLAYVIYTSGSTGAPKGVAVTHRNVVRLFSAARAEMDFGRGDVWSWFHSPSFDFSVWEIWGPLLTGGTIVVVPPEVARSPEEFVDLVARHRVTILSQTPTAFRGLAHEVTRGSRTPEQFAVRFVIFGGEVLHPGDVASWLGWFAKRAPTMVNMYGITETTVHVTFRPIDISDLDSGGSPIGRPLRDLSIVLLDSQMMPVPIGQPGQIFVGGAGVARGYFGQPRLTAERFVPDPFGCDGQRLYRTGDVARVSGLGELDFVGRADEQLKVRGFRIEPGEIENALLRHPAVSVATVILDDRAPSGSRLIAYVVGTDGASVNAGSVRDHLADLLPAYMIPARIVPLDSLPLTRNGKVDKAALREVPVDRLRSEPTVQPIGPLESAVAEVWREALDLAHLGRDDNFFSLGGDSIRAVRVVGLLKAMGMPATVRNLFLHQTLAEFTRTLPVDGAHNRAAEFTTVDRYALIGAGDRERLPAGLVDAYPMSLVQVGMLHEMLSDRMEKPYHNVTCYFIPEESRASPEALVSAAKLLTARHEILRTSLNLIDFSEPLQLVYAEADIEITVSDLSGSDVAAQHKALAAFIAEQRTRPFDPSDVPQIRLHMHHTSTGGWWLSLIECHAILDGWSHNSLVSEIVRLYRAFRDEGATPPDPTPSVRFADFVALERAALASPETERFWRERIDLFPKAELPLTEIDTPAPRHCFELSLSRLMPRLKAVADLAGVPVKTVLIAAHVKVISSFVGRQRFHVGLVSNGRLEVEGGDRVLGMHLNTVPLAVDLKQAKPNWLGLIEAVFVEELKIWEHRRYPIPRLQQLHGHTEPLIDIVFTYLNFHVLDRQTIDVDQTIDESPNEFPLCVWIQNGDQLCLTAHPGRITARQAASLISMYEAVLTGIASNPYGDSRTAPVTAPLRRALLHGHNRTNPHPGHPALLHELVIQQAQMTPDAVALAQGRREVTYRDLIGRATKVAAGLRCLGVGPEDVVAVCLPEGIDFTISLLGVLMAGGAYLPLDTRDPDDRLQYMLEDAGAKALVTMKSLFDRMGALYNGRLLDCDDLQQTRVAVELSAASPDNLAYIIYTSGTTGRPKAVAVSHRGPVNSAYEARTYLGAGPGDQVLQFASPAFDLCLWQKMMALTNGATAVFAQIVPVDDAELANPDLNLSRLTHVALTPATISRLVPEDLPNLRVCMSGGEACPPAVVARWAGRARFINVYGPTETAICATAADIGMPLRDGSPPIGYPLPNTTAYVLDDNMEPAVDVVAGELFLGGVGVARGYLRRAAATARAFVPDPFSSTPGARLYRTGDIVRRDESGALVFVGRRDSQVKVRGHRIELVEVEAAFADIPQVAAVAVKWSAGRQADGELVAYIVPANPGGLQSRDIDMIRQVLSRRLPPQMIPSAFVPIANLPLTVNGKVDRASLPDVGSGRPNIEEAFAPARSALEMAFARIWAEVLGLDTVGVRDDFIDLGCHSLAMTRIILRVREERGIAISLADFYRHRTIERIAAACVARVGDASTAPALVWLRRRGTRQPLFCVHPVGGSSHWFVPLAASLPADQPVAAFEWPGLSGVPVAVDSLDELASRYIDEIRDAQGGGPYRVLSWCTGSALAWAMVSGMRRQGEDARLFLIDPVLNLRTHGTFQAELESLRRAIDALRALEEIHDPVESTRLQASLLRCAASVLGPDLEMVDAAGRADSKWLGELLGALEHLWSLHAHYEFAPSVGELHLFTGDDVMAVAESPADGIDAYVGRWSSLSGGQTTVHKVVGDHDGVLLPPNVVDLAATLDLLGQRTETLPAPNFDGGRQ